MAVRSGSDHSPLRIVLARPQLGENIGFVLRLCANHDVDDVVLVAPRENWRAGAERTASMCTDRIEGLRVEADLEAALADRQHIFGLTARVGRERRPLAVEALGALAGECDDARVALLFGNEESGLDSRETACCTQLVRIDRPGLSSLNLSHAVAITCTNGRADPAASHRRRKPSARA